MNGDNGAASETLILVSNKVMLVVALEGMFGVSSRDGVAHCEGRRGLLNTGGVRGKHAGDSVPLVVRRVVGSVDEGPAGGPQSDI